MSITLSTGIPAWFMDDFDHTIRHVQQQTDSKFAQAVMTVPIVNAEDKAFNLMGDMELVEKTGRNEETPTLDPETQRRWVDTTPYHQSVLYDKDDDLMFLLDATSSFNKALKRGAKRKKDDIILAAMDATVNAGRHPNSSTITWAAQSGNVKYTDSSGGRTIPHDCSEGNCDASHTGMTVEKIELVKEYFATNDVDEDMPIWIMINPRQATNLFGQEEYVNTDYQEGRPLATGYIKRNWHGINWIVSTKVVKGSSNDVDSDTDVFRCFAWAQEGIVLGVADEMTVRISEVEGRSYSQRVYVHINMGAMRLDEDLICVVECQ